MRAEYDSDDFDMESVTGTDNPVETDEAYDASTDVNAKAVHKNKLRKPYTVRTRFKSIDKKTGQMVYKVVEQPSNVHRKLAKPYSYKKRKK